MTSDIKFSKLFDNTNLKANATKEDIKALCLESIEYDFATVAINTVQVALARDILADSNVGITGVIAFPLGQTTISDKVNEAKTVLKNGASEVDYVINISELKAGNKAYMVEEMQAITDICHQGGAICKVIFENAYLTDQEKLIMCEVANQVGIDFVKTSTGFAKGVDVSGATLADVELMRKNTDSKIGVKASGGVSTLQDCENFVQAGASRIGTSAGVKIMQEYIAN